MAATSIFFNGRYITEPGSYSKVDVTGLDSVGLGASGIVAVVGTAEGGRPAGTISETVDIPRFSSAQKASAYFRSGDLKESVSMVFNPSNDPDIPGGAQEFVAIKVNPATQSTVTLANTLGDSLVITSADYGEFANQIYIELANGTNQGKMVTAVFEDETEVIDDVGGDVMFTLLYRPCSGVVALGSSWDTMTADMISSGLRTNATKAISGADSAILLSETGAFTVSSSNAADTSQIVYVVGVDSGAAVLRSATLNGTSSVSLGNFSGGVFGAYLSAVTAGDVDVDQTGTNITITAGAISSGGTKTSATYVNLGTTVAMVADGASTADVYLVGRTSAGVRVIEAVTLNGTTPVASAGTTIAEVEFWGMGAVAAARTVTASATALQSVNTTQTTLVKLNDYFNARQVANSVTPAEPFGFNFTLVTGNTTLATTNLDLTDTSSPVNVDLPTTGSFYADLYFLYNAITNQMSLINATAASGAIGVPDNTSSPVYLTGGGEGTTTTSNWQTALNLLKTIRVNTVVVLTGSPTIHDQLKSHLNYMCGIGRSERDGFVGLLNTALTGPPTKAEIKSQIITLNSRHIRAAGQTVERFNSDGERQTFPSYFRAAMYAGMQAGSEVGTSLTRKLENSLSLTQDSSWNPLDDVEEMIGYGLIFTKEVDGIGRQVVRNVTTNVSSSNIAFTEGSVNEAVNFAVYNYRTNLEFAVGKKGFAGTVNATKSVAISTLDLLVKTNVITSYRALQIELALDVLDTAVEIAPVIPINFVRSVLHLFNPVLAAA